jgi:hypothetical protein
MLHMFCNGYTCVFLVFQTYVCKCFNCFRRILQMFPQDISKVDLMLHMLQWDPSAAAIGPACMRVGVTRRERQAWETVRAHIKMERRGTRSSMEHGTSAGHGATWAPTWSRHRRAGGRSNIPTWSRCGRLDASLGLDIWALAFPLFALFFAPK